jgi:hypothetical protein
MGGGVYGSDDHAVTFDLNPHAAIFKSTISARVLARVCGECGHIALFVENPAEFAAQFKLQRRQ